MVKKYVLKKGGRERRTPDNCSAVFVLTPSGMAWVCQTWIILQPPVLKTGTKRYQNTFQKNPQRRRARRGEREPCTLHAADGVPGVLSSRRWVRVTHWYLLTPALPSQGTHRIAAQLAGWCFCHWPSFTSSCNIYSHLNLTSIVLGLRWCSNWAYKWKELNALLLSYLLAA